MAELESVQIHNPTSQDFTWNYNGEPYTVKAGETKSFARPVSFHLAKHLSSKMIDEEFRAKHAGADFRKDQQIAGELAQLAVFDNPFRRIALYKIFKDVQPVLEVIKAYPFKGFIGEMSEYENFVKRAESKESDDEE